MPARRGSRREKPAPATKPRSGADRPLKAAPNARRGPASDAVGVTAPLASEQAAKGSTAPFPIVGIGASAGGLDAFELFFKNVPKESGMAFVVVQHLDPNRKGMLPELLQRASAIPVAEATDGLRVEPDHVYVIPPNSDMSLLGGELHLLPQATPRGLNLPIDFFFRSLAADRADAAIGVLLSGMGSDGMLGLRAIKEKAGAVFVQALSSAKFDGMPRSAIDAGLADVVAPPEELPGQIMAYLRHVPYLRRSEPVPEDRVKAALGKVCVLLRAHTGNDFSLYKTSTIQRRIERRMGLHQLDSINDYVRMLRDNPREVELLFKELLIGVTCFFRDPEVWQHLKDEALPALLAQRPGGGTLRAWVPGCSTGEEAFSLAMIFKEVIEPLETNRNISLQIFATDLDRDAIDRARQGLYPDSIAADVSSERLARFFVAEERGYRVTKEIREMVVFATQNVIMDPPFTRLDLLSCRNLLIYLSAELQKKLIPLFHYSLSSGGILILGSAETVGAFTSSFVPLDSKLRLYRRTDQASVALPVELPSSAVPARHSAEEFEGEVAERNKISEYNVQALTDRLIVTRFAPLAVLCGDQGDVLYISGRAGKYLEPAVGKANLNVFGMAKEGLRHPLSRAFSAALRDDGPVVVPGVKVGTNGGVEYADLTVQRLLEPRELRGTVIVVIAGASPLKAGKRGRQQPQRRPANMAELGEELQRARDEAQIVRDQMQTSREELKSTNEELQSTNEELQSTNEELTTSKEEMQSLNEELQTVNHELQAKVDELSRSNNDMKNLLNSTDIATLFLDDELRVRRFTTPTAKIIKLIPSDAGRTITDIASDLEYPALAEDAREVLRTLVFKEKQVAARDGRWFSVRIMPYRTVENVIDGVVITFTDVSAARAVEQALRQQASELRQMAECLPSVVWSCRPNGACEYLSPQWAEYTGKPESEQLGYRWLEQVHADDRNRVQETWRDAVAMGQLYDSEFRLRSADGAYRWFKARSKPISGREGTIVKWYGTMTDVDDLERAKRERGASAEQLAAVLDVIHEGFIDLDEALTIRFFNTSAEHLLGYTREQVIGRSLWDVLPHLRTRELPATLERARQGQTEETLELALGQRAEELHRLRIHPRQPGEGLSIFFGPKK